MSRLPHPSPLPLIGWGLIALFAAVTPLLWSTGTHRPAARLDALVPETRTPLERARGRDSALRSDLRQRSERIVRALDTTAGTIHLTLAAESDDRLQFVALDAGGHFLAEITWDVNRARLLGISRQRWRRSPGEEPGGVLSATKGAHVALYWLRRIGQCSSDAWTPEPERVSRLGRVLAYQVHCGDRRATISLDRHSGALVTLQFDRERTSR